jgi:hypothetical protein
VECQGTPVAAFEPNDYGRSVGRPNPLIMLTLQCVMSRRCAKQVSGSTELWLVESTALEVPDMEEQPWLAEATIIGPKADPHDMSLAIYLQRSNCGPRHDGNPVHQPP